MGLVATQVKKDNALCEGAVQKTRSRNIQSTPVAVKSIAQARPIVQEVTGTLDVTVYLFGSWARGEAASYSDIDIAVDSPHPLPRGFLSQLRERFEESTIPQCEDDQYVLIKNPDITIQCCEDGSFSVNQWDEKDSTQTFHKTHSNLEDAIYHAVEIGT